MKVRTNYDKIIHIPFISNQDLAAEALAWRQSYLEFIGQPTALLIEPENMIWDFMNRAANIDLFTDETLTDPSDGEIRAATVPYPDGSTIIHVNKAEMTRPSAPFTIAHELLHALRHAPLVHKVTNAYLANPGEHRLFHALSFPRLTVSPRSYNRGEQQANYFAACLLMPADDVRQQVLLRYGAVPLVSEDWAPKWSDEVKSAVRHVPWCNNVTRAVAHAAAEVVSSRYPRSLAETFGVSSTAMAVRLYSLDLVVGRQNESRSRTPDCVRQNYNLNCANLLE